MKPVRLFGWTLGSEKLPEPPPERAKSALGLPGEVLDGKAPPDTELRGRVIAALRQIYDPEIPVNIYDLGLIYELDIDAEGRVSIRMTLTAPACPVAQAFPARVATAVESVNGVSRAGVELVWEPPWDIRRATEAARLQMGFFT